MKNCEISSAKSLTSLPHELTTAFKKNTNKPPLPKRPQNHSRMACYYSSKSNEFGSLSKTKLPRFKSRENSQTLFLTPKKVKCKLSLSPNRKPLRRKESTRRKLMLSI